MSSLLVLAGNQNCGKTTLFNRLTGNNQHVGNFPGVTIEKKEGKIKALPTATLVDLPGIYSLSPYTPEEVVTRDFLLRQHPAGIVNIVDATNIERNLYLTLQLMELGIPIVIALNMMDEVHKSGNSIDVLALSKQMGVPIVPISAAKNEGIDDLLAELERLIAAPSPPRRLDFCTGAVHRAIHAIAHIVEDKSRDHDLPTRYVATKLLESDEQTASLLQLTQNECHIIEQIVVEMEFDLGIDREAALADMRYQYIEQLCHKRVKKHQETLEQQRAEKVDRLLTHKYLGIPIFFGIMFLIFSLTFSVLGPPMQDLVEAGMDQVSTVVETTLTNWEVSPFVISLLVQGVLAGIASVLSFLPMIILLFFFLSLLEDSGYMARVAFLMDKMLRKIGLSGRSFVPMLLGFGCSVPAILSTRTLSSHRDRKTTIVLIPFLSCSAKLPIYGMITTAFFPSQRFVLSEVNSLGGFFSALFAASLSGIIMLSLYLLGMLVAILSGLLFQKIGQKGSAAPFVLELPAYRIPFAKTVLLNLWGKAWDFIRRAFTIILGASVVIWLLQNLNFRFQWVTDQGESILASIASLVTPLFAPLGIADWRIVTSLFTGLIAKEMVVSTLSVLTSASSSEMLASSLQEILTPLSAYSFLVFTVLYMPCVAAFAATKRELGSLRQALLAATYQTGVAYLTAMLVFGIGSLILALV